VALLRVPKGRLVSHRATQWTSITVGAVVVATVLFNGNQLTTQHSAFLIRAEAFNWFTHLHDEIQQWSAPSTAVVPLNSPYDIAAKFVYPYARLEVLLPVIHPGVRVGLLDPGSTAVVIDTTGRLRPAGFAVEASLAGESLAAATTFNATMQTTGAATCVTGQGAGAYLRMRMPKELIASPMLVEVAYTSQVDTSIRFTGFTQAPGSTEQNVQINPILSPLYRGSHTAVFALEAADITHLQISGLTNGLPLCITSLQVVLPVTREPDGTCRVVDTYGDVGGVTACPPQA
jgi:hypothetical protein